MMPCNIKKICSFLMKRKCTRKILIVFVTLSNLNKTLNRAVLYTILLIKCMKIDVICYKSNMHVRPMRFSILCTPTDNSVLICKSSARLKQSMINVAFKTPLETRRESVFINLHFCIDPMTILVSHKLSRHILQQNCAHVYRSLLKAPWILRP